MKHLLKRGLQVTTALAFACTVATMTPVYAQGNALVGVTVVADVSGDAQNFTARTAQKLMREVKQELDRSWASVDLSLVAFGNGLETRVDRHGNVKPGEIKELLLDYSPEAAAPDEPALRALRVTARKLKAHVAGEVIVLMAGGDLRQKGPDESSLENPKIDLPKNTHVILMKTTPEAGRDLRKLGEGLERNAETVSVLGFGKEERARKRIVKQISQALEEHLLNAVRSGNLPELVTGEGSESD
ncbi:hypothetical protein [Aliiroseovarius sp. F20344]|uniref:hypothetical protein n=1 Tax=Aliiroseovarius sp. F20344 TaxID=2926414 RepID=UPI001FF69050|nr:hypothetical protein [Aliiroseovarius sp. F20344]MCK0143201.1 hypothetical protein [Aliiroseovarius sp. F20344]